MENSMERHRRYAREGSFIAQFHAAWGKEPTMEKFGIKSDLTLEKILQREGSHAPRSLAYNPAFYEDSGSLYEALAKGIARALANREAQVQELQEKLVKRDERIAELHRQLADTRGVSREREETVLTGLVLAVQRAEEQVLGGE